MKTANKILIALLFFNISNTLMADSNCIRFLNCSIDSVIYEKGDLLIKIGKANIFNEKCSNYNIILKFRVENSTNDSTKRLNVPVNFDLENQYVDCKIRLIDIINSDKKNTQITINNIVFDNPCNEITKCNPEYNRSIILTSEKFIQSKVRYEIDAVHKYMEVLTTDEILKYLLQKNNNNPIELLKILDLNPSQKKEIADEWHFENLKGSDKRVTVDSILNQNADIFFNNKKDSVISEVNKHTTKKTDNIIVGINSIKENIDTLITEDRIGRIIRKNDPINIKGNLGLTIDYNYSVIYDAQIISFGPILSLETRIIRGNSFNFKTSVGLLGFQGAKFHAQIGYGFNSKNKIENLCVVGALFKGEYKENFSPQIDKKFSYGGVGLLFDYYFTNKDVLKKLGINTVIGFNKTLFEIQTEDNSNGIKRSSFYTIGPNAELKLGKVQLLANIDILMPLEIPFVRKVNTLGIMGSTVFFLNNL